MGEAGTGGESSIVWWGEADAPVKKFSVGRKPSSVTVRFSPPPIENFLHGGNELVHTSVYPLTPAEIRFGDREAVIQVAAKAIDEGQAPSLDVAKSLISWMLTEISSSDSTPVPYPESAIRKSKEDIDVPLIYPLGEDDENEGVVIPKGMSKTFPNGLAEYEASEAAGIAQIICFETLKNLDPSHHEEAMGWLLENIQSVELYKMISVSLEISDFIENSPQKDVLAHQIVDYVWQNRKAYGYIAPLEHGGQFDSPVEYLMRFGVSFTPKMSEVYVRSLASLDNANDEKARVLLGIFVDSSSYPNAINTVRQSIDHVGPNDPLKARLERLGRMLLALDPDDTTKPFHTSVQALYEKLRLRTYAPNVEAQKREVSMVEKLLGRPENVDGAIVDLACGEGRIANALAKIGYRDVVGVDISKKQLVQARIDDETHSVAYWQADWKHTGIPSRSVALVAKLGRSFHNAKNRDEFGDICKEVARVLQRGGTFLFDAADPNKGAYLENRKQYVQMLRSLRIPLDYYRTEADLLSHIEYVVSTPDGINFNNRLVLDPTVIKAIVEYAGFDVEELRRDEIPGWGGAENIYFLATKE